MFRAPMKSHLIAGDTAKHLSLAVAPIVLTTQAAHVREVPLGSTAIGKTRFSAARQSIRCLTGRYVQGAAALRKFLPLVADLPFFNPFKSSKPVAEGAATAIA
jgi:hypothetical protein